MAVPISRVSASCAAAGLASSSSSARSPATTGAAYEVPRTAVYPLGILAAAMSAPGAANETWDAGWSINGWLRLAPALRSVVADYRYTAPGNAEQQATAGLWIEEHHLRGLVQVRGKVDVLLEVRLVVDGAAGKGPQLGIIPRGGQEGDGVIFDAQAHPRCGGHLPAVAQQAEPGHVRASLQFRINGQLARAVV